MQRGLQRTRGNRLPEEVRRGRELREADEGSSEERRLSWPRNARRSHHQPGQGLCHRRQYFARFFRVPDALRDSPRPAAPAGAGGLADAGLYSVRDRVVSVSHAPAGGTPGQCVIHRQKSAAPLNFATKKPARKSAASIRASESKTIEPIF